MDVVSYIIGYQGGLKKGSGQGVKLPELDNPAGAAEIREGYEVVDENGEKLTGTMPKVLLYADGIVFDKTTGKITTRAGIHQNGYIESTARTAERNLDTLGATTIIPGAEDQVIEAYKWLTGDITVKAASLTIKSGSFMVPADHGRQTITHGFDVVPDLVMVFPLTFAATEITSDNMWLLTSLVGLNSKYADGTLRLSSYAMTKPWIADDGTKQVTFFGGGTEKYGLDNLPSSYRTDTNPWIYAPNNTTFEVGCDDTPMLMPGASYTWIAICNAGNSVASVYYEAEGLSF